MRAGFRTKLFLGLAGVAAIALLVAAVLISIELRRRTYAAIEESLVVEVRLVAELLAGRIVAASDADLDEEADRLGRDLGLRITFIARDGRVVGDSGEDGAALAAMENHGRRPEVIAARPAKPGIVRRYSATLGIDMLYVAVPTRHPSVAIVRLAMPLVQIEPQLRAVVSNVLVAFSVALVAAFGFAWAFATTLGRRVEAIAAVARRYNAGDLRRTAYDYGDDELGTVAHALDDSVQQIGRRVAELTRAQAHMQATLTAMTEGVLVVDARGRVVIVNEAASRMLALEPSIVGRSCFEALRHPSVVAEIAEAFQGREPRGVELSLAGASVRSLIARAAPVAAAAGGGAVLALHDVTDIRRADRMRRDFVANVSHELRTPLTAIRGYIEAARDEAGTPRDREKFLAIIARHATRMERLVNDLLRLARLEAGQESVEIATVEVQPLFDALAADVRPLLDRKQQRLQSHIDPAAERIDTDVAKLQDALRNLLENASGYSPDGSTIYLHARARGERMLLTVTDEGAGIPEPHLTRIFERFYRVDRARSRETGGTGLGLFIVKHLVDRLGGRIWAQNHAGGGAVFTISLRAVDSQTTAVPDPRNSAAVQN
ncbi:MAG: PAS domain-containing protein [Acidobacteria bacterium]|nr:PAS domain-containing protein [Acidobacteriota bacterium]